METLSTIKVKYKDGTYSNQIPISILSKYVKWNNKNTLVDVLGEIDINTKGSVQDQLDTLFTEKIDIEQLRYYVANLIADEVTDWLDTNINPISGDLVIIDSSLSISGAAADAKETGDQLDELNERIDSEIADVNTVINIQIYGKTITHSETVATQTANILTLDEHIPAGIPTVFKNTSTNTVMSLGFIDKDGVETRLSNGLIVGETYSYTTTFPVYAIRNWTNGTEWTFTLECGEDIENRLSNVEQNTEIRNRLSNVEQNVDSLNNDVFSLTDGISKINNVGNKTNIVVASDLVAGYINKTNGAFAGVSDGGYHTAKLAIDAYPVVFLSATKQYVTGLCCLYDSDGIYITSVDDTSTTELVEVNDWEIDFLELRKTYSDACYFACGTYPANDSFALYTKDDEALEEYIDDKTVVPVVCAVIGDSRTEKLNYVNVSYPEVIKNIKKYSKVYNWGVSGASYVPSPDRTSASDIVNAHDFSDVDIVVINFGFNDYGRSLPIGTPGDTTDDTVCGAIYTTLTKIYNDNPKCSAYVFTPLPNLNVINNSSDMASFQTYVTAIKNTCDYYKVTCYDSWNDGALSSLQATDFFDYDNTHATDYTVFGIWIASHLP